MENFIYGLQWGLGFMAAMGLTLIPLIFILAVLGKMSSWMAGRPNPPIPTANPPVNPMGGMPPGMNVPPGAK